MIRMGGQEMNELQDKQSENEEWIAGQAERLLEYMFRHVGLRGKLKLQCHWAAPHQIVLAEGWAEARPGTKYWLVCGPGIGLTDHVEYKMADNPRDALRHFTLKWQLQAERLRAVQEASASALPAGLDGRKVAGELTEKSEFAYRYVEDERYWKMREPATS